MTARWEEVLDYQLELWKFWRSDAGRSFAEGFTHSVMSDYKTLEGISPAEAIQLSMHQGLVEKMERMAWLCEPIYVDPDMMTLAEAAAKSFKAETFKPQDLITEAGFVLLPRPIMLPDINDHLTSYRAFSWYPFTVPSLPISNDEGERKTVALSGVALCWFHHVSDKDWYTENDFRNRERPIGGNFLILSHLAPFFFGAQDAEGGKYAAVMDSQIGDDDPRSVFIFVQAFWRLMQQTITVKDADYAGSKVRNRLGRAKFPEKRVTIIKLRRPRPPVNADYEPRDVDWHHRWLVSGHWRNQYFPSVGLHRQVWISPYIKGPEDKPLELRKLRVFELVR